MEVFFQLTKQLCASYINIILYNVDYIRYSTVVLYQEIWSYIYNKYMIYNMKFYIQ